MKILVLHVGSDKLLCILGRKIFKEINIFI